MTVAGPSFHLLSRSTFSRASARPLPAQTRLSSSIGPGSVSTVAVPKRSRSLSLFHSLNFYNVFSSTTNAVCRTPATCDIPTFSSLPEESMTQSSPNPFIGAQLFVSSNDIREDEVRKEAEMEWRAEASLLGDGYRECLFGAVCLGITDPCQGLTNSMPAISMSSHPVHFTGTPLTSKSQRKAEAMYPVPLITLSPPRDVRHTDPERSRSESSNTPLSQRSSSSPILELSHCQSGTPVQNTHRSPTLPSPYTQRDRFANNHRVQSRRQGRKVDKYEDATPGLSFQSTFLPTRERDRRAFVAQYDESPTPPTTWVVFQTPPEGADLEMQGWQGRRKDVGLNRAIRNGKKQEKRKG